MKIRNGFVSNSSSSSFIISGSAYKSVSELASIRIKLRDLDNNESEIDHITRIEERNLKNLKYSKDIPMAFDSCNYETYIVKQNGKYYVNTCNNHRFHNDLIGIECHGGGSDEGVSFEEHIPFFWPRYNQFYIELDWSLKNKYRNVCKNGHFYDNIKRIAIGKKKGKIVCVECEYRDEK